MKRKIKSYYSKEEVDAFIYGIFPKDKKRRRIEWIILGVCIVIITLLMLPR